jgi:hypothetical protein
MIDIGYIMNYMKVLKWLREDFITLCEIEKMFHLFSNSINWEIFGQGGMRFKKGFKSYSNDQLLLCRESTWFNMANMLLALMLNKNISDKMVLITMRNW